jgi:hypothetical protein
VTVEQQEERLGRRALLEHRGALVETARVRRREQRVEVGGWPSGERLEAGDNGSVDAAHDAALRRRAFGRLTLLKRNVALFDSMRDRLVGPRGATVSDLRRQVDRAPRCARLPWS